ncbi:MAG: hypothetical protein ACRD3R_04655, partial [Terriglobales bacterium]
VQAGLLLERIAEREGLEVEEAALDQEIARLAQGSRQSTEVVRARLTREGALAKLRYKLRNEKAHEFLFRNSVRISPRKGETAGETGSVEK